MRSASLQTDEAHTANKQGVLGHWQQVRGRTREWWGRLTEGDLNRTRQFERFVGHLQAHYGFSRERAAMILRWRMLKQRSSRSETEQQARADRQEQTECKTS